MKKHLMAAVAVLLSLSGYAQTKGTNTLGLTLGSTSLKSDHPNVNLTDTKSSGFNVALGYGFFVEDNSKISLDLSFGRNKTEEIGSVTNLNEGKNYGANFTYQKYFPLVGKFYAYAGARGSYTFVNQDQTSSYNNAQQITELKGNSYGLGAIGGLSWFFAKHWALETQLLSAGADYSTFKRKNQNASGEKVTQTNFSLNNGGFFNNTSFKVYFLF